MAVATQLENVGPKEVEDCVGENGCAVANSPHILGASHS